MCIGMSHNNYIALHLVRGIIDLAIPYLRIADARLVTVSYLLTQCWRIVSTL